MELFASKLTDLLRLTYTCAMSTGTSTAPGALTLEIASIIRSELARQKMSKTELAAQVGTLSRPQITKMVNGLKPIDIEDLDRILFVLGLDMKTVLRQADAATPLRHKDLS